MLSAGSLVIVLSCYCDSDWKLYTLHDIVFHLSQSWAKCKVKVNIDFAICSHLKLSDSQRLHQYNHLQNGQFILLLNNLYFLTTHYTLSVMQFDAVVVTSN